MSSVLSGRIQWGRLIIQLPVMSLSLLITLLALLTLSVTCVFEFVLNGVLPCVLSAPITMTKISVANKCINLKESFYINHRRFFFYDFLLMLACVWCTNYSTFHPLLIGKKNFVYLITDAATRLLYFTVHQTIYVTALLDIAPYFSREISASFVAD